MDQRWPGQDEEGLTDVIDQANMERIALGTLADAGGLVGASRLVKELRQQEIVLSEVTAGRFLRSLDRRGLTRPIGRLGRLLTEEGHSRLNRLQALQRQGEHSAPLVGAATPIDVDEPIDLLNLCQAVELGAARHTARRTNGGERVAMRAVAMLIAIMSFRERTTWRSQSIFTA